jgi:hypothetical protein
MPAFPVSLHPGRLFSEMRSAIFIMQSEYFIEKLRGRVTTTKIRVCILRLFLPQCPGGLIELDDFQAPFLHFRYGVFALLPYPVTVIVPGLSGSFNPDYS